MRYVLVNQRTRAILATDIEPAFDPARRRQGLLGRDGLAPGAAMVLAPCTAVHTCFMRFPIDILFVGRGGDVLRVRGDVGPWRVAFAWRGFATIECGAGAILGSGTIPGDRLQLERQG